jgi:hypothetical protein
VAKRGLWANIWAKRKRIAEGSGERMRKPGEKGAPTAKALKDSQTSKDDYIASLKRKKKKKKKSGTSYA